MLALGGGAFVDRDNIDLLDNHGVTIWLDCPFDLVKARVMKEFIARWPAIWRSASGCITIGAPPMLWLTTA